MINNRSWANNHENFGKSGTLIANLPTGHRHPGDGRRSHRSNSELDRRQRLVRRRRGALSQPGGEHKLDVEPNSDHTLIAGNTYQNNGRHPHPAYTERRKAPGGDLFWDGSGVGNQWRETGDLVTFPTDLLRGPATAARPAKESTSSTDTTSSPSPGGSP